MPAYDDKRFDPPAPIATVTLRNSENGETLSDVMLLIDSGADVTLIPQSAIELLKLNINADESYELMGFDGTKSLAQVVQLDLIFLRRTFRGRYLLINQDCGILGRDILNHLSIVLNGPFLEWSEQSYELGR